jgi:hypothetical protein
MSETNQIRALIEARADAMRSKDAAAAAALLKACLGLKP